MLTGLDRRGNQARTQISRTKRACGATSGRSTLARRVMSRCSSSHCAGCRGQGPRRSSEWVGSCIVRIRRRPGGWGLSSDLGRVGEAASCRCRRWPGPWLGSWLSCSRHAYQGHDASPLRRSAGVSPAPGPDYSRIQAARAPSLAEPWARRPRHAGQRPGAPRKAPATRVGGDLLERRRLAGT